MVENLTTQLEIKYVYSADVSEKKYKAEFKDKFKTITFDNGGEFMDDKALEKSYDKRKKEPRVQVYYIMRIHIDQENEETMKMQID